LHIEAFILYVTGLPRIYLLIR